MVPSTVPGADAALNVFVEGWARETTENSWSFSLSLSSSKIRAVARTALLCPFPSREKAAWAVLVRSAEHVCEAALGTEGAEGKVGGSSICSQDILALQEEPSRADNLWENLLAPQAP